MKGTIEKQLYKERPFCQSIKLEKTHKISCECWFEWLLTCLKYCSEAKTSSLAKDAIMYEAKSALIQCKLDFIGSIAKKIEMSQSNHLSPHELICQSQNKYTHILWNNPKWWPRKCSDTMKFFRLAPFLPNEIFCQLAPTPKDSLEGGKNNIRA